MLTATTHRTRRRPAKGREEAAEAAAAAAATAAPALRSKVWATAFTIVFALGVLCQVAHPFDIGSLTEDCADLTEALTDQDVCYSSATVEVCTVDDGSTTTTTRTGTETATTSTLTSSTTSSTTTSSSTTSTTTSRTRTSGTTTTTEINGTSTTATTTTPTTKSTTVSTSSTATQTSASSTTTTSATSTTSTSITSSTTFTTAPLLGSTVTSSSSTSSTTTTTSSSTTTTGRECIISGCCGQSTAMMCPPTLTEDNACFVRMTADLPDSEGCQSASSAEQWSVQCCICGHDSTFVDVDSADLAVTGYVRFGPAQFMDGGNGVEVLGAEKHISEYRIYLIDSEGERQGLVSTVAADSGFPDTMTCCRSEAYTVKVSFTLPSADESYRLLIVPVTTNGIDLILGVKTDVILDWSLTGSPVTVEGTLVLDTSDVSTVLQEANTAVWRGLARAIDIPADLVSMAALEELTFGTNRLRRLTSGQVTTTFTVKVPAGKTASQLERSLEALDSTLVDSIWWHLARDSVTATETFAFTIEVASIDVEVTTKTTTSTKLPASAASDVLVDESFAIPSEVIVSFCVISASVILIALLFHFWKRGDMCKKGAAGSKNGKDQAPQWQPAEVGTHIEVLPQADPQRQQQQQQQYAGEYQQELFDPHQHGAYADGHSTVDPEQLHLDHFQDQDQQHGHYQHAFEHHGHDQQQQFGQQRHEQQQYFDSQHFGERPPFEEELYDDDQHFFDQSGSPHQQQQQQQHPPLADTFDQRLEQMQKQDQLFQQQLEYEQYLDQLEQQHSQQRRDPAFMF